MKARWRSVCIAPLILNLSVVQFTPQLLYPQEGNLYPLNRTVGTTKQNYEWVTVADIPAQDSQVFQKQA